MAIGKDEVINQARFSLLSLIHKNIHKKINGIYIFTDRGDKFIDFKNKLGELFSIQEVSPSQVTEWMGPTKFMLRAKVEIMKKLANTANDSICFCDSDTYFINDPSSLFNLIDNSNSVMHEFEYSLLKPRDPLAKKISRFAKKFKYSINGGSEQKIPNDTEMWNSGMIGVSKDSAPLWEIILQITDQLHQQYPKHVMEQLAVSHILQANTKLHPGNQVLYHYWNQKDEYAQNITSFFNQYKNLDEAMNSYNQFSYPKPAMPKQSLAKRVWTKILGSEVRTQ